jgi:hypothetical protein
MTDRRLVEPKAGSKRPVDGILSAVLADVVGVRCQPIGQIDPQPVGSKPPEGERSAARIGASVEHRRRGLRQARHWLAGADRQ